MSENNGYKCGNCGSPGVPFDKIPDAIMLIEIPAACANCVNALLPNVLTGIICDTVKTCSEKYRTINF